MYRNQVLVTSDFRINDTASNTYELKGDDYDIYVIMCTTIYIYIHNVD